MHPTQLPAHVVDRVVFRRGRLHGFESIEPRKTALVVVDMQNVFCAKGAAVEVPAAREIVSNINRLARATRASGGVVVWIQMAVARWEDWALVLDNLLSPAVAQRTFEQIKPGSEGHALWPEMETDPADLFVAKNRYSALIAGSSSLERLLRSLDIDTLLIAGTKTNICCEATARDAMMLDFKVVMVSDCCAALSDEEHRSALENIIQQFGDVMTGEEVLDRLRRRSNR